MGRHFGSVDYLQLLIILIVFISALIVNLNTASADFITHWSEDGSPAGHAPKVFVLFVFPVIILIFYLLFLLVPYISHHESLDEFYDNYGGFRLGVTLFLSIVYYSIILQNFGMVFNMNYIIIPAFACLFYYLGHLLSVARPNHYIGFRTTWTQSSDYVWTKTHSFSGFLFKSFAFISLLSLIFPQYFLIFFVVPLIVIIIVIIFYSKKVHDFYLGMVQEKHREIREIKREQKGKAEKMPKAVDVKTASAKKKKSKRKTAPKKKPSAKKKSRSKKKTAVKKKSSSKSSKKKGSSGKKAKKK